MPKNTFIIISILLITCFSINIKAKASISSKSAGQQACVTHWASTPLKSKSKDGNHPAWYFKVEGAMKEMLNNEILDFKYILIKHIPTRGAGEAEIVARIDRSKESVFFIETLNQCQYTTRLRLKSGPLVNYRFYTLLEFYDKRSKCILKLSSTPTRLLCFTTKNGNHRSLLEEFLLFSTLLKK